MFLDDKIIEIFSMCDDFSKNFDDIIQKNSIDARESTKKRKYHRDGTMSDAEVMTILVLFHGSGYRCLKHFYLGHVCNLFLALVHGAMSMIGIDKGSVFCGILKKMI